MGLHDFNGLAAVPTKGGGEFVHKAAVDCIRRVVADISRLRPLKSAATGVIE
jgi:hypothetical protein